MGSAQTTPLVFAPNSKPSDANVGVPISQIENEMKITSDVAAPKPPSINPKYIKFIGAGRENFGFGFVVGRNVDIVPFDPRTDCAAGGLYFCTPDQASIWISAKDYALIAEVEIPDGAEVVHMEHFNKSKANVIDITSITPIEDHPLWQNPKFLNACIELYPKAISKIATIPDNALKNPSFLDRNADALIGRPEMKLEHYILMGAVSIDHIGKFPAEITDNPEFWDGVIKKNPNAVCFKRDSIDDVKIFYGASRCKYLGYRNYKDPAMKFLGSLYGGFSSKMEDLDDSILVKICRWSVDGANRIPADRLTEEMRAALRLNPYLPADDNADDAEMLSKINGTIEGIFDNLISSNEFLSKLREADLLSVLFGGFVREVVIKHLEDQSGGSIRWDDLKDYLSTSDIDLCVDVPIIRVPPPSYRVRSKSREFYDLKKLVTIVKECRGTIEFYSLKYCETQDRLGRNPLPVKDQRITAASAGTYAVWIPIQNTTKSMRYDINVGTSVTNSDTLLNSLTVSVREPASVKLNGTSTAMLNLLRSRVLMPSNPAVAVNAMSSQLGKCLIRTAKLYTKGYKLDPYTGLIYYLQILRCQGLCDAVLKHRALSGMSDHMWKIFSVTRWGTVHKNQDAVMRTSAIQPVLDDCIVSDTRIIASKTSIVPVTPEFVLNSLPYEFESACASMAATWNIDYLKEIPSYEISMMHQLVSCYERE